MTTTDEDYLAEFRALAAQRQQIADTIAALRRVCESLQDWQKAARELAPQPGSPPLPDLAKLREQLADFHRELDRLRKAWAGMRPEQRTGLAAPDTLAGGAQRAD